VLATEVGHLGLALDYATEAALLDLDDFEHNTRDGLHVASLAGAWIALVTGFGGMRDSGETLRFSPRLPDALTRLSFSIHHRGACLRVEVTPREARYSIAGGTGPLRIQHHGEPLTVVGAEPVARPIPPSHWRERPQQPPGREPRRLAG
jgi:alpha,alpha-trehalose phosphorylase